MSLRNFIRHTRLLIQQGLYETRKVSQAYQRPLELTRLEERVLFSASALAPVVAEIAEVGGSFMTSAAPADDSTLFHVPDQQLLDLVADSVLPPTTESDASTTPVEHTLELVFLDSSISNQDQMIRDLRAAGATDDSRTLEFVILDSQRDGIAQITSALLRYNGVDGLHIVSQGEPGRVQLGSTTLSLDSLDRYRAAICAWQYSMSDKADLLFYGCDLAGTADGLQMMYEISLLTEMDVATGEDLTSQNHTATAVTLQDAVAAPSTASTDPARTEVVFLDTGMENYQQILADLQSHNIAGTTLNVVLLDDSRDGLQQVNAYLASLNTSIDAVHFLTHGTDRAVKLGSTWIDTPALNDRHAEIEQWSRFLTPDADLLFYGCDLAGGESGRGILQSIAAWTGADVAASDDATGAVSLSGDWDLEYRIGDFRTQIAVSQQLQQNWNGLMATFTVTNINDSGAGSLRQAILDANGLVGTDTITFSIAGSGLQTISLASALPLITDAVVIDGTTQSGYAVGTPVIELNGTGAGAGVHGLQLDTGSSGSTIQGLVVNRFGGRGIYITNGSGGNLIAGNYLGTDATGLLDRGNGTWGIDIINGGSSNIIGGNTAALRNVISGNNLGGVALSGASVTNTVIQGNYIGVGADGSTALGNTGGYSVLLLGGPTNATIGGTGAGEGNIIANNTSDGVEIWAGTARILGNSIYGNAGLGIDLTGDGITANDAAPDSDSGANNLQNFPVLTAATTAGGTTNITGSVTSAVSTNYRVEFFATSATLADATNGEGRLYLGFVDVLTNSSGVGAINTTLNLAVNNGDKISATATNLTTNTTSEFAANITAAAPTTQLVVDTTRDVSDGNTTSIANLLANRGADGLISLREAIAATNATAGANIIRFNIPGSGTHTINLTSGLPTLTEAQLRAACGEAKAHGRRAVVAGSWACSRVPRAGSCWLPLVPFWPQLAGLRRLRRSRFPWTDRSS